MCDPRNIYIYVIDSTASILSHYILHILYIYYSYFLSSSYLLYSLYILFIFFIFSLLYSYPFILYIHLFIYSYLYTYYILYMFLKFEVWREFLIYFRCKKYIFYIKLTVLCTLLAHVARMSLVCTFLSLFWHFLLKKWYFIIFLQM